MAAHLKQHAINNTLDHAPGTNGTLLGTESNAVAEKAFGTSTTANLIVQRDGSGQLNVPITPTAAGHATSKQYVDNAIISGTTWKELVLVQEQLLSGGSGAILQGILLALAVNPSDTSTLILTDGTTTETFTFLTSPVGAFDVQIGGSAAATTTNLVSQINTDSTLWSAVETSGLDDYLSGANDPQLVIYRTASSSNNDRVHGTQAGAQSDIQVVEFATGTQDYREGSGTQSDLPSGDPAAKRFGFGRVFASLQTGDTHRVANDNTAFTWDGDDDTWQNTDTGTSVTEGNGIDITAGKISTDVATAILAQQFGGIVNTRTSDGSGAAGADAGFLAVHTDNSDLVVNASNQLAIKSLSRLDKYRADGSWTSGSANDKTPTLSELNSALGTTANDIGNRCMMVEDGTAVGSNSTFWAYKKANSGTITDYHLVELSEAA